MPFGAWSCFAGLSYFNLYQHSAYCAEIQIKFPEKRGIRTHEDIKAGDWIFSDKVVLQRSPAKGGGPEDQARDILAQFRRLNAQTKEKVMILPHDTDVEDDERPDAGYILQASDDELIMLRIYDHNAFTVGLCVLAAHFEHSCLPNVAVSTRTTSGIPDELHFHARRDIMAGEKLTITFVDQAQQRGQRAKDLEKIASLACKCPACKEDSFGWAHDTRLARIQAARGILKGCRNLVPGSAQTDRAMLAAKELTRLTKDEPGLLEHALYGYSCIVAMSRLCGRDDLEEFALREAVETCRTLLGPKHPLVAGGNLDAMDGSQDANSEG